MKCRVLKQGFANNNLVNAGQIIDFDAKSKKDVPSWLEPLDEKPTKAAKAAAKAAGAADPSTAKTLSEEEKQAQVDALTARTAKAKDEADKKGSSQSGLNLDEGGKEQGENKTPPAQ